MASLEQIRSRIAPLRGALLEHALYDRLRGLRELRIFMESHVFAVWDFMSLLKTLQARLCNSHAPWTPPENSLAARFVNEIVLGEECDADGRGGYASHFELYRDSMLQCGADTGPIDTFVGQIRQGVLVESALRGAGVAAPVRAFVGQTFETIATGDLCRIASAFTFGREDLLPSVFRQVVLRLNAETHGRLDRFRYYLDRHIELDDEEHGPMAARLVSDLCGEDAGRWQRAEEAAVQALKARLELWDRIAERMRDVPQVA